MAVGVFVTAIYLPPDDRLDVLRQAITRTTMNDNHFILGDPNFDAHQPRTDNEQDLAEMFDAWMQAVGCVRLHIEGITRKQGRQTACLDWVAVPAALPPAGRPSPGSQASPIMRLSPSNTGTLLYQLPGRAPLLPRPGCAWKTLPISDGDSSRSKHLSKSQMICTQQPTRPKVESNRPGSPRAARREDRLANCAHNEAAPIPFLPLLAPYGQSMMSAHIADWWRTARRRTSVGCPIRGELLAAGSASESTNISSTLRRCASQWVEPGQETLRLSHVSQTMARSLCRCCDCNQQAQKHILPQIGATHKPCRCHRQGALQIRVQFPLHQRSRWHSRCRPRGG